MKSIDVLIAPRSTDDLLEVAPLVFEALGVADYEERDSENWGGTYFLGHHHRGQIRILSANDFNHPDLPLWLNFDPSDEAISFSENFVLTLVRLKLIPLGFKAALMQDLGRKTEKRIDL